MTVFLLCVIVVALLWVDMRAHDHINDVSVYFDKKCKDLEAQIADLKRQEEPKRRRYRWDQFGDKYDAETGEGPLPDPDRDALLASVWDSRQVTELSRAQKPLP